MEERTSYFVRIQSILSDTVELLCMVEPAACEYGTFIKHSQKDHFFSSSQVNKKEISTKYFQFSIRLKDILKKSNNQIMQLTDIMLSADRRFSEPVITVCNQALLPYVKIQEGIALFLCHTEKVIASGDSVSLQELSLTLRQFLFQIQHTCDELKAIIAELNG